MKHNSCHFWIPETKCWKTLYDVCQSASDQLLLTGGSKRCGVKVNRWLLNLVDKTWTQMLQLSNARHKHRSVTLDQYVYALGRKCASMKVMESVERFNIIQHLWSFVPGMPQSVSNLLVISYGHRIYVFSGCDTIR